MLNNLFKPLGIGSILNKFKEGHFEFSTGVNTDDGTAPAEWVAAYISKIVKEDRKDEIMGCWTVQDGLKKAMDDAYTNLKENNQLAAYR